MTGNHIIALYIIPMSFLMFWESGNVKSSLASYAESGLQINVNPRVWLIVKSTCKISLRFIIMLKHNIKGQFTVLSTNTGIQIN